MKIIVDNIKWIMLVTGVLTCTMLYAAVAPQASLQSTFGVTLDGPAAEIVVRNWGALIGLVGAMLIYGAFHEGSRKLSVVVALVSKAVFIGLMLTMGQQFMGKQAGMAVYVDSVEVLLFAIYLLGSARSRTLQ